MSWNMVFVLDGVRSHDLPNHSLVQQVGYDGMETEWSLIRAWHAGSETKFMKSGFVGTL